MKAIKAVVGALGFSVIVVAIAAGQIRSLAANNELEVGSVADANGNLHMPDGYRTAYEFPGTRAAAADQGQGAQELHIVYASPGTINVYRKDRHFPDGAVLVKEVYRAATEPMTTGTISHSERLKGWFVMLKESSGL
jgi:hypothetical protein